MVAAETVVLVNNLLKTSFSIIHRGSLWALVHCGRLVFEKPAKTAAPTKKQSLLPPVVSLVSSVKH